MNIAALVVDRRSQKRSELSMRLKRIGVRKVASTNVREFMKRPFKAGAFDIVLIEFNTLMEAGRSITRSLRQMDLHVPLLVTYPESVAVVDLRKYCPDISTTLVTPVTDVQLREAIEQQLSTLAP